MTPKDKSFLQLHWLEQPVSLDITEAAPDRMSSTTLHIFTRGMWALPDWGTCLHSVPHRSGCQLLLGLRKRSLVSGKATLVAAGFQEQLFPKLVPSEQELVALGSPAALV